MAVETLPVTFEDVRDAAARLAPLAHRTPVMTSDTFDARVGAQVFFKCENLQRGGAFKFRGAFNAISRLDAAARRRGVVAFSSGNHAQAVALVARILAVPATVVMPSDAPAIKVAATRGYGAEVVSYDRLREDRAAIARRLAAERGLTLVPPFDDARIIAGQGTVALELLEQVPDLDALVVPIGGGGLISGCAIAAHRLRPGLRVIGVEPEAANDTWLSLQRGERVRIDPPDTIADGLRPEMPGELTFAIMRARLAGVVLVDDATIAEAVRFLLLRMKILVEPSGAAPAAALLAGRVRGARRIGVVLSGGNADPAVLARLLAEAPPAEAPAGQAPAE
jgi:threonine dehydratase